jgi:hypothetical protein
MKQLKIPIAYRVKEDTKLGVERLSSKLLISQTRVIEFMVDYFDKCDNEQLKRAMLEGKLAGLAAEKVKTEKEIKKLTNKEIKI